MKKEEMKNFMAKAKKGQEAWYACLEWNREDPLKPASIHGLPQPVCYASVGNNPYFDGPRYLFSMENGGYISLGEDDYPFLFTTQAEAIKYFCIQLMKQRATMDAYYEQCKNEISKSLDAHMAALSAIMPGHSSPEELADDSPTTDEPSTEQFEAVKKTRAAEKSSKKPASSKKAAARKLVSD